ncbi:MAG: hypothetical protein LVS60_02965 [Nodosilinea sp. LVE1205-7]
MQRGLEEDLSLLQLEEEIAHLEIDLPSPDLTSDFQPELDRAEGTVTTIPNPEEEPLVLLQQLHAPGPDPTMSVSWSNQAVTTVTPIEPEESLDDLYQSLFGSPSSAHPLSPLADQEAASQPPDPRASAISNLDNRAEVLTITSLEQLLPDDPHALEQPSPLDLINPFGSLADSLEQDSSSPMQADLLEADPPLPLPNNYHLVLDTLTLDHLQEDLANFESNDLAGAEPPPPGVFPLELTPESGESDLQPSDLTLVASIAPATTAPMTTSPLPPRVALKLGLKSRRRSYLRPLPISLNRSWPAPIQL